MGHEYRVHRPDRSLGTRGVSRSRAMGRAWTFKTEAFYANGVHMSVSGDYPNGIKFYGTKGWIFVSRGNEQVTKSDPVAKLNDSRRSPRAIRQSSSRSSAPTKSTSTRARNSTATGWTASSAETADIARRNGAPRMFNLSYSRYGHGVEAQALLGSGHGAFQERRRSKQHVVAPAKRALHAFVKGTSCCCRFPNRLVAARGISGPAERRKRESQSNAPRFRQARRYARRRESSAGDPEQRK